MSLLGRIVGFITRSSFSSAQPKDPVVADWFSGRSNTVAGISINADKARQLTVVAACVRVISSALASLPVDVYSKDEENTRTSRHSHPVYNLLHFQPNAWQTSFEFREMMQGHLLLRGNAYARKVFRPDGAVAALIPLHPDRVEVAMMDDGKLAYEYTNGKGGKEYYLQYEILHLRGMSSDGIKGLSPIQEHREALGLTMAAEQFGAQYFGNGTVLSGVLEHPGKLSVEAKDYLKETMQDRHTGVYRAHGTMVLEEGMKWQALGVKPEEAQFLETRKFQVTDIARIFGVPPHMIGDVEKSTSWGSGIEQQGIGFVVYCLRPWLVRWEQVIKRDLLSTTSSKNLYAEFNVEGLLRGDSKSRSDFYKAMFGIGCYSQNDIRRKENEPPIEGGDKYYVPVNMMASDEPPPEDQEDDEEVPDNEDEEPMDELNSSLAKRVLLDGADRLVNCETKALERFLRSSEGNLHEFERKVAEFYKEHDKFIVRVFNPILEDGSEEFAKRHISHSLGGIIEALRKNDPSALGLLIDSWREKRSVEIVDSLIVGDIS